MKGLWSLIVVILITPMHADDVYISYSGFSLSSQISDLCSTEGVML